MSQRNPTDHEIDVFATAYVLDDDKSQAWRSTFPNSKSKPEAVWVAACRMHKLPKVQLRIKEKQAEIANSDRVSFDVSYEAQLERCIEVYRAGLKSKFDPAGNEVPINLAAAQSAIGEINKMAGHHAAIKNELSGKDGEPLQIVISGKDAKL